jgi:hypothetical protein
MGFLANIIGVSLLLLFAAPVLTEVLIRSYQRFFGNKRYLVRHPKQERIFVLDRSAFPGVKTPSRFKVNSIGIRGDEITAEQTYRILIVGSSTSACLFNDQDMSWPCLLQKKLNELGKEKVWVGNAALAGLSTREHIIYFKRLIPQLPLINTIIVQVGYMDLFNRLITDIHYNPQVFDDFAVFEKNVIWSAFYKTPYFPGKYEFKTGHFGRLAMGKLYLEIKSWYKNMTKAYDNSGEWIINLQKMRMMAKEIVDDSPDLSSALAEYRRNISTLTDMARLRSIRLIFVTDPSIWKDQMTETEKAMLSSGVIGSFKSGRYYSSRALFRGLNLYHKELLTFCAENWLECLDLASAMPKTMEYFIDDIHLTDAGCSFTAQYIAEAFTKTYPFAGRRR